MKTDLNLLSSKISRTDLENYYKLHTIENTKNYFGIRLCELRKLLKFYNIKKSKEDTLNTRKSTCLEKYGVENIYQDKERMRLAYISKFGVDNPYKSEEVKERIKQTNLEKYGVTSPLQNKDILNKMKDTTIDRYGGIGWASKEINEKFNKSCIDRYGFKFNFSSNEFKELVKEKSLEKYGVEYFSQSEAVKEKIKNTNLKKRGVEYSFQSEEVKNRIKETCLEKYGEDNYNKTEEAKIRRKEYIQKKIEEQGFLKKSQSILDDRLKEILYSREKSIEFLNNNNCKYSILQLSAIFNCSATCVVNWIKRLDLYKFINYYTGSKYEDELYEILNKYGFVKHAKILDGKEIDLYNDDIKIGIEFNGTYWHSDINKYKKYHEEKSKLAENKGIRLIHIYEYEWNDKRVKPILLSMLNIACGNVSNKIFARNCEIRKITNKDAKDFNNKNHLQGHRNAQVTYGLFYKGELVQLMSFSKHKKYEWEIIRGCPGSNNIVVGGVSKLFKHFINEYNPKSVFSYCDFNKFDGKGYEAIGMKFIGYTGPDKKWIVNGKVYNRQPSKYKQFKELAEACIWGAGSKKYLWEA